MKLGVYTAILHDRPLAEALDVISGLGLDAAEINAGGFLPPVHIPIDDILTSESARDDYLAVFAQKGVTLAGLTATGNPLHPNPTIGPKHAEDLRRSIKAAGLLGQTRVVTMSGLPGGEPARASPTGSSTRGTRGPSTFWTTSGASWRCRSGERSTRWPRTTASRWRSRCTR